MAETMNYGWLQDYQGVKFAPKTLLPYIFNTDGVPIEQNLKLQNLKVINQITGTADNSINANQLSNITVEGNTRIWTPISKGSNIKPVYFENGIPKEIGYTIEKNVPADANFNNTEYDIVTQQAAGLMSPQDKIKLDNFTIPEIPEQIVYQPGDGINITNKTISHKKLSSELQDISNQDRTYVKSLKFDDFGHVIGYSTGQETVESFELKPATTETLGGIKPGNGLAIEGDGTLNVTLPTGSNFELKPATALSLGGIKASATGAINVDTEGTVTLKNTYAGAEEDGGAATSAKKLTSGTVGSEIQPVYFSEGVPYALNNTIETGTWNPRLNYTDTTFQVNSATYIKIGNLVVINFIINSGITEDIILPGEEQYFAILTSSLPYVPEFSTGTDLWYAGGGHLQYAKRARENCYFTGWAIAEELIYARGAYFETKETDGVTTEGNIMNPTYMLWPSKAELQEGKIHAGGTIMYKTTGEKNTQS